MMMQVSSVYTIVNLQESTQMGHTTYSQVFLAEHTRSCAHVAQSMDSTFIVPFQGRRQTLPHQLAAPKTRLAAAIRSGASWSGVGALDETDRSRGVLIDRCTRCRLMKVSAGSDGPGITETNLGIAPATEDRTKTAYYLA